MPSPPARSPPNRVGPLRSRRGCRTCKTRKVKCGEEKPSCRRCIAGNYQCAYDYVTTGSYASAPSTTSILDLPVSTSPNTVWRERRAFAYYFEHAAPYLSGGLDQDFWVTVVPQVCRTEPAVWDAINAISTLFEHPEICHDFIFLSLRDEKTRTLNSRQSEALGWYSRSLSKIQAQIDQGSVDTQVALISSILFMCIETLQGRVEDALQLYNQGIKLILDLRAKTCTQNILLEGTIIPLFIRLGTAALTFSGVPVSDLFRDLDIQGDYVFYSLQAARDALVQLAAEILILERDSGTNPFLDVYPEPTATTLAKQNYLHRQLDLWHHAYMSYTTAAGNSLSKIDIGNNALLVAFHTTLTMVLSTCLSRLQCVYDAHLANFQLVVKSSEIALESSADSNGAQPAFTFELGVGLPLYYTALHCREPVLRRKALALLQKAPPMQGFHKCGPPIALASKIMQLEEGFSSAMYAAQLGKSVQTASPADAIHDNVEWREIPEEARIQHYAIFRPRDNPALAGPHDVSVWARGPEQLFLRFTRNQRDVADERIWHLTDELVPMD
ncbi:hypothetical protein BJY04DRAFT_205341 [Aspergillus karnatakaensis]|uniref:Zn(II)2Cys6 transcription factor n=1 Tax=Aspergillus karnatakaensis TaxID=1810916 RepID=UPI003CCD3830